VAGRCGAHGGARVIGATIADTHSASAGTQDRAPDGQRSTWAVTVELSECCSSIQGRRRGSKTFGNPRAQIPECLHSPGFQITVTPFRVYFLTTS